jgi:hypothetical protein
VRAHEYPIDATAGCLDFTDQAIVDFNGGLIGNNPPPDGRLVSHQDYYVRAVTDLGEGGKGTWINKYIRPGAYVIWAVFYYYAIPIQENCRMHPENYTVHD